MVTLGLEELLPLLDGCLYDGIVVAGEGDVWPVRFEEILINMEARPERFEGGFQSFDCVLLAGMV